MLSLCVDWDVGQEEGEENCGYNRIGRLTAADRKSCIVGVNGSPCEGGNLCASNEGGEGRAGNRNGLTGRIGGGACFEILFARFQCLRGSD